MSNFVITEQKGFTNSYLFVSDSKTESVVMENFSTESVLCAPSPTFTFKQTHHFLTTSVNQLLRKMCSQGSRFEVGSVPFQLWCRFYYPNIRDQLVCQGELPITKIFALTAVDVDSLTQLQVLMEPAAPQQNKACELNLEVNYCNGEKARQLVASRDPLQDEFVTISMRIDGCCGLKAALSDFAGKHGSFYVTVSPPKYFNEISGDVRNHSVVSLYFMNFFIYSYSYI